MVLFILFCSFGVLINIFRKLHYFSYSFCVGHLNTFISRRYFCIKIFCNEYILFVYKSTVIIYVLFTNTPAFLRLAFKKNLYLNNNNEFSI